MRPSHVTSWLLFFPISLENYHCANDDCKGKFSSFVLNLNEELWIYIMLVLRLLLMFLVMDDLMLLVVSLAKEACCFLIWCFTSSALVLNNHLIFVVNESSIIINICLVIEVSLFSIYKLFWQVPRTLNMTFVVLFGSTANSLISFLSNSRFSLSKYSFLQCLFLLIEMCSFLLSLSALKTLISLCFPCVDCAMSVSAFLARLVPYLFL